MKRRRRTLALTKRNNGKADKEAQTLTAPSHSRQMHFPQEEEERNFL